MPKSANYSKSFIYKIVCNDITIPNIYVGSSTDFTKRKSGHKSCCNNENNKEYNKYLYQFMRENGGWDNWTLLKICDYPCQNKFELELEERRFMELLQSDLNKNIPTRTQKEYQEINKEKIQAKNKEYRDEDDHKEKMKQYQDIYQEKYREDNKEKIQTRKNAVDCCPTCGCNYTHSNKARHLKSKQHNNTIEPV